MGGAAEALAPRVRAAGCVFVGSAGATAFGDYVCGSNHILPTGGAARFASGVSARTFRRRMAEVQIGRDAARALAPAGGGRRAGGGLRRARRVDGGPHRRQWRTLMTRTAEIDRTTKETDVRLSLGLDGSGAGARNTGVGFLDHMLDLLARHGRLDLDVAVEGDLETGSHHTVEDTGICLGQALDQALGDRVGIHRYGEATVPMDEARASCTIDISGRPFVSFEGELPAGDIAGFENELTEEFFRAVATHSKLTVHMRVEAGSNAHHMIEASFKAFARALRAAIASSTPRRPACPRPRGR